MRGMEDGVAGGIIDTVAGGEISIAVAFGVSVISAIGGREQTIGVSRTEMLGEDALGVGAEVRGINADKCIAGANSTGSKGIGMVSSGGGNRRGLHLPGEHFQLLKVRTCFSALE